MTHSLSELLQPIPGPNPSGKDIRYTTLYEQIKEARREDPDLPQGVWAHQLKVADWAAVVDLCTEALVNQTKDLQVAAWLTEALLHRDGFPGLTQGLNLLRSLVGEFWSTVYPRSEDDQLEFRAGPLEWVGSRLDVAVNLSPSGTDYQARISELESCLAALGELHAISEARFGDMSPDFEGLRTSLESAGLKVTRSIAEMASNCDPECDAAPLDDSPASPTLGEFTRMFPSAVGESISAPVAANVPAPLPQSAAAPDRGMDLDVPFDRLHFTLTSPLAINPASSVVITLWVHLESQRGAVIKRACRQYRAPGLGDIMSVSKGPIRVRRGATLSVCLKVPGARIEDAEDSVLWDGEIGSANFVVTLRANPHKPALPGIALIYFDGVQIAKVQFVLQVGTAPSDGQVPTTETRLRSAFASYASPDRDEVLGRLQGIRKVAPYLDIFFDVLTLQSGQGWKSEIEKRIFASDVFYLFWSTNASSSEWVEREWRTALRTGRPDFIDPVPLQPPEEAPPPVELAGLHFNDWMLAFKRGRRST